VGDAADPLATVMERKITRNAGKHAQTRIHGDQCARGIVKDGSGVEIYDYFDEFGYPAVGRLRARTAGTNVQAKCREVLRDIETELKGETMAGVSRAVSPGFLRQADRSRQGGGRLQVLLLDRAQPLREDTRRRFPFSGIVFEEYNATVTLSTGATET